MLQNGPARGPGKRHLLFNLSSWADSPNPSLGHPPPPRGPLSQLPEVSCSGSGSFLLCGHGLRASREPFLKILEPFWNLFGINLKAFLLHFWERNFCTITHYLLYFNHFGHSKITSKWSLNEASCPLLLWEYLLDPFIALLSPILVSSRSPGRPHWHPKWLPDFPRILQYAPLSLRWQPSGGHRPQIEGQKSFKKSH